MKNNIMVKEERELLTINFLIKKDKGYKLAKEIVKVFNSNKIKYKMEKNANTYNFCCTDIIFSVTQIAYEDRMAKISVRRYTGMVKRIMDLIISQAKEYFVPSEDNGVALNFRRIYELKRKQPDLNEVLNEIDTKLVYNIPIEQSYSLLRQKCKARRYIEIIRFSIKFKRAHLEFLSIYIQRVFAERKIFLEVMQKQNLDIA